MSRNFAPPKQREPVSIAKPMTEDTGLRIERLMQELLLANQEVLKAIKRAERRGCADRDRDDREREERMASYKVETNISGICDVPTKKVPRAQSIYNWLTGFIRNRHKY